MPTNTASVAPSLRASTTLLAVNLASSVVEALSEGATLAVVFLAVEVLTAAGEGQGFDWSLNPLVATALFISLLALAVLLQALQSLSRFANKVSVGTFAAECRALVAARIHSQVLLLMGAALSDWGEPGLASP